MKGERILFSRDLAVQGRDECTALIDNGLANDILTSGIIGQRAFNHAAFLNSHRTGSDLARIAFSRSSVLEIRELAGHRDVLCSNSVFIGKRSSNNNRTTRGIPTNHAILCVIKRAVDGELSISPSKGNTVASTCFVSQVTLQRNNTGVSNIKQTLADLGSCSIDFERSGRNRQRTVKKQLTNRHSTRGVAVHQSQSLSFLDRQIT